MKRIFYLFSVLLAAISLHAENVFVVDEIDVKQGEEKVISVALTNDGDAASAAIDIALPEGLSFVAGTLAGSVEFSDRAAGMMSKSSNIRSSGELRVGMAFGTIAAGSGELFTFKVKASDAVPLGSYKITYTNQSLTINSAKVTIPDMQTDINVIKVYSVSVQTDGYTGGSVAVTAGSVGSEVKAGTSITVEATAAEGYHFVKWSDEATDNPYTFTVTADKSLTASFAPNKYKITFDSNGGTAVADLEADYKAAITAPEAPTKTGYTFAGWNPEFPETMPLNGATLTAQWTPILYTLTYNLAGGAVATANPIEYTIESEAITLNNPTREGYTFAGWTGTDLTEAIQTVTIAKGSIGNREYTATWTPVVYAITYDLAGGAVATDNPATYTIETADFTLTNPTREGYTFAGWTGTDISEATQAVTIAKGSMGNRSYVATWTPILYTLTYNLAGGEVATANPTEYTIESEDIILTNPTREG